MPPGSPPFLEISISVATSEPNWSESLTMRNHKPKDWTEAGVQLLVSMVDQGAKASEVATALERYIGSVKPVARDMCLMLKK